MPAIPVALTIAQGTATAALEASSLIWTGESKEPAKDGLVRKESARESVHDLQIVHNGARKLKINA